MTATVAILFGASLVAATPTPIEIWPEGDAGDVQRLATGIRSTFEHSPHFVLTSGHKPGTLYIYVPAKIVARSIGTRVEYSATLQISQAAPDAPERLSSVVHVNCWEDDLAGCGMGALARAEQFRAIPGLAFLKNTSP